MPESEKDCSSRPPINTAQSGGNNDTANVPWKKFAIAVVFTAALAAVLYLRAAILDRDPLPVRLDETRLELKTLAAAAMEETELVGRSPDKLEPVFRRLPAGVKDRLLSNPDYRFAFFPGGTAAGKVRGGIIMALPKKDGHAADVSEEEADALPVRMAVDLETLSVIADYSPEPFKPLDILRLSAGKLPGRFGTVREIKPDFGRGWEVLFGEKKIGIDAR